MIRNLGAFLVVWSLAACKGEVGPAGSPDTGAQILAKLAVVDGAGSGLDADAVDGLGIDQLQRRISETCPAGTAVVTVNSDGTLVCRRELTRVVWVRADGTPAENGALLLATIETSTAPTEAAPRVIRLEPGVFDVGASPVVLKPYLSLEGAGENATRIQGSVSEGVIQVPEGTDATVALRHFTVVSTGTASVAVAVTSSQPTLEHVTANAQSTTTAVAFRFTQAGGTLRQVTGVVSPIYEGIALQVLNSYVQVSDSRFTAGNSLVLGQGIAVDALSMARFFDVTAIGTGTAGRSAGMEVSGGVTFRGGLLAGDHALRNADGTFSAANVELDGAVATTGMGRTTCLHAFSSTFVARNAVCE